MKSSFPFGILIILSLAACDPGSQRRIQRDAVLEEMENREPKKLTEAQIIAEAFETGREIAGLAEEELLLRMKKMVHREGMDPATAFEELNLQTFTDSLSKAYQADIRQIGITEKSSTGKREALEQQLMDAYLYNQENNIALEDNVQTMGQDYFLYTLPIVLPEEENFQQSTISGDSVSAVAGESKRLGKLAGVWSILLSRKELVINM